MFDTKTRTQPITKDAVWRAWKHVRRGSRGGGGIDGVSAAMIDASPAKYLYPLWNRLASGSYMPPAVKEVGIPKPNGGIRKLGIPTLCDRVAQEVIRRELEAIVEPQFLPSSFGYRPNRSAFDALEQCRKNSWERWYVVDIDIKGYFDNIDHELMMNVLRKYTDKKHVLLYCSRWLKAPVLRQESKTLESRLMDEGLPLQHGV